MRNSIHLFCSLLAFICLSCGSDDNDFVESYDLDWEIGLQDFSGRNPLSDLRDDFPYLAVTSSDEVVVAAQLKVDEIGFSLFEIDPLGNVIQSVRVSGTSAESISDFRRSEDGTFRLLIRSFGTYRLLTFNDQLNMISEENFSQNPSQIIISEQLGDDGVYFQLVDPAVMRLRYQMVKTSFSSDTVWRAENLSEYIIPNFIVTTGQEVIFLSREEAEGVDQVYFQVIDRDGEVSTKTLVADGNTIDEIEPSSFREISVDSDGSFFLGGANQVGELLVAKLSDEANVAWRALVGEFNIGQLSSLRSLADGGLVTALVGESSNTSEFTLIKHDANANLRWQGNFFTTNNGVTSLQLVETSTNDLIVLTNQGNLFKLSPE